LEKVFVDIGAHTGSSAVEALSKKYNFDRVISVEPDLEMVKILRTKLGDFIREGRYDVAPYGLSHNCRETILFGNNSGGGASLFRNKSRVQSSISQKIILRDWTFFVEDYRLANSLLFIKMNCEGAEVEIVNSILSSEHKNIISMVIDFDIIKVPFGAWKKWNAIRKLRSSNIQFFLSEDIFVKNSSRIAFENWLFSIPEIKNPTQQTVPRNNHQYLRIKWLELCSALGIPEIRFRKK
jgi:FkbM family methyltransferase